MSDVQQDETPKSAADLIGEEWAAQEEPRAEGFMPPAPEAATVEEAPDEEEAPALLPDEEVVASVGGDPEEHLRLLEDPAIKAGLKQHPHWVNKPELTDAELRSNAAILQGEIEAAATDKAARRELFGEALEQFQAGEDPAAIADALQQLDPSIAGVFANHWRAAEAEPVTALDWLTNQDELSALLNQAAQIKGEVEATEAEQAKAQRSLSEGVAAFERTFSAKERAVFGELDPMAVIAGLAVRGADIPTDSPEAVTTFLRGNLAAAQQYAEADRAAKFYADWDADRAEALQAGWGVGGAPEDGRKSYEEHLQAELEKRVADGRLTVVGESLPTSRSERGAQIGEELVAPHPGEAGYNVGPKLDRTKKGKTSPILDDPLFDDPHERIREEGWNIG